MNNKKLQAKDFITIGIFTALLFDEPTSGLDHAHMKKVGELLKQLADSGSTVLVSTHDPELLEQCCDYELCIRKGRVAYFRTITTKECSDV